MLRKYLNVSGTNSEISINGETNNSPFIVWKQMPTIKLVL